VRTVTLITLVSSVFAAMPRIAGAEAGAAAPVPAPQTALGREIGTLLPALRPALVLVPVAVAGYEVAPGLWFDAGVFFANVGMESWVSRDNRPTPGRSSPTTRRTTRPA
jgi:hypothetical protein